MHLAKKGSGIESIQKDFGNGIKLIQLLEVIGGESLGKYNNNPKMKIHSIENINVALKYISTRGVKLVGISSEDVQGENLKLILGMIWTIILRFAIADISEEELNAKEALLLWCKKKTAGYKDVKVENFTGSWQDGLALCALIHAHRPDLLDFSSLDKNKPHENCKLAFDIAEKELGIPQLLDVEDLVDVPKPEERSVMTYIAEFYHVFSANRKNEIAGRRIGKLVDLTKTNDELKHDYENKAKEHTAWVKASTEKLGDRNFDNSLEGIKKLIAELNNFKSEEKPPKVADRQALNSLNNTIQVKLSSAGHPAYTPPEGLSTRDINELWDALEKAQQAREDALLAELARQQLLALLSAKFDNKAKQLENWIDQQKNYLNQDEEIDTVEAAEQRSKALQAFRQEYEQNKDRLRELHQIKDDYVNQNGPEKDSIVDRANRIQSDFDALKDLADSKNSRLDSALQRQREMEELRKKFANAAKEYNYWAKDTVSTVNATVFPDSLQGVEKYIEDLNKEDATIRASNDEKKQNLDNLWEEEQKLGIKDNQYTVFTNVDIASWHKEVLDSLDARRKAYESELERQKRNEEKRKEFAAKADEFVQHLEARRGEIDSLQGEPKDLIESVRSTYGEGKPEEEKLKDLSALQEELASLGIMENNHTKYTLPQLQVNNDRFARYIRNKIAGLESEDDLKRQYNENAKSLLTWIEQTRPTLRSELDNTLEGARNTKDKWTEYKTTTRAQRGLDRINLESLFNTIQAAQKANNRPAFVPDSSVSLETVAGKWEELSSAEREWESEVNNEVARQEKLFMLSKHFNSEAEVLESWVGDKTNQLNNKSAINSLDDSRIQLLTLDVLDEEVANGSKKIDSLKERASEIANLNYKDIDTINSRVSELEGKYDTLKNASKDRRSELQSENENQEKREALRVAFADQAKSYVKFVNDSKSITEDSNFGTTLEDVKNYSAKLDQKDSELNEQSNSKKSAVESASNSLSENSINDNRHTSLTLEDINKASEELKQAIATRRENYNAALKKQEEHDADRQQFAKLAEEFVTFLQDSTASFKAVSGSPSEKAAAVKEIFQEGAPAKAKLDALNELNTAHRQKGIYSNQYTPHTMQALDRRLQLFVESVNSLLARFVEEEDFNKREVENEKEFKHKQDIEQKRLDFEFSCKALLLFLDSVSDTLTEPIDVSSVGAVEDLLKEYEATVHQVNEKQGAYDQIVKDCEELNNLGVPTTHEQTTQRWNDVQKLIADRKNQLNAEHSTQQKNDALCKQFADKANATNSWIDKTAGTVADNAGDLETQLKSIRSLNLEEGKQLLDELAEIARQISEANVRTNPYTELNVPSVKARLEEISSSKKSKEAVLEKEILSKKHSTTSPEQIEEFKEVFKHFDKNNTNSLNRLEFKGVLQSLGEDPSDDRMNALMAELADAGGEQIGFDNFLSYMIKITSDTSSQDEISAAFRDLAQDKDFITADDLRRSGMPSDKIEYLLGEMPAFAGVEGGFDYKKWASAAFSR